MVILPGQGADDAHKLIRRLQAVLAQEGIHVAARLAEATGTVTADVLIRRADRGLIAARRGPAGRRRRLIGLARAPLSAVR